jgi:hypothetical protein
MKIIRNATPRPLRVKLPGGKVLFLGPGKTGEIADGAEEHPGVKDLVEAGELEIVGDGAGPHAVDQGGTPVQRSVRGHRHPLGIPPKGDR